MIRQIVITGVLCTAAAGQTVKPIPLSYYLPSASSYDPRVPTPESFFGFQVGEWHLHPEAIHSYFRALEASSPRIRILPTGRSYEEREMVLAVVTSPGNHANLESIRRAHVSLSDPETTSSVDISTMPVVVWMGYSVHGNEASGSNASVLVAYALAASDEPEVERMLETSVVLLNPSINPDGLHRFAAWVNANKGRTVDPSSISREHNEPWPGGRTNHYWFDLNRDWMPLQHPESRARIARYYEWRPNVLTDHHEMGTRSTFFFQPGVPSRNNPLTPASVTELASSIAQYHARGLDSIGSLYYMGESYDDFYIGKGSSYPDITGGIGFLFEQASARGHAQENGAGVLTFPYAIRNQVTTSFTTLRASLDHRERLLEHQRSMALTALTMAAKGRTRAYIFGDDEDASRTRALAEILRRHNISVFELAKRIESGGTAFIPEKAFVVPVRQSQYRLITSLFEKRTSFDDSLFYDVSSWTLPLAFGLPYAEHSGSVEDIVGEAFNIEDPVVERGTLPPENVIAYAIRWKDYYAARSLYRLLSAGAQVRVSFEPFTAVTSAGRENFDRGTIIVPTGIQQLAHSDLRRSLDTALLEDGIHVSGITSGLTVEGIDLGSPGMRGVEKPVIALAAGPGVSPGDAGEVWHLFDQRFGFPVTLVDPAHLGGPDLDKYNVLILPGGNYRSTDSSLPERLRSWVQKGNTLIALEDAAAWAVRSKLAGTSLAGDVSPKPDTATVVPYAVEEEFRRAKSVPGTIVSASADLTHPLLFGYSSPGIYLFKTTSIAFETSGRRARTPIQFSTSQPVGGYLHDDFKKALPGKSALAVAASGRGRVILFSDDPVFRAFWYGTTRLLLNAVFFSRLLDIQSNDE